MINSDISQLKDKIAVTLEKEYASADNDFRLLSERRKSMLLKFEQFIAWSSMEEEKPSSTRK